MKIFHARHHLGNESSLSFRVSPCDKCRVLSSLLMLICGRSSKSYSDVELFGNKSVNSTNSSSCIFFSSFGGAAGGVKGLRCACGAVGS